VVELVLAYPVRQLVGFGKAIDEAVRAGGQHPHRRALVAGCRLAAHDAAHRAGRVTIEFGFGDTELMARDLSLAFVLVAIISSLSVFIFARLKPDAGAAVSGRMVSTSEERATAAAE